MRSRRGRVGGVGMTSAAPVKRAPRCPTGDGVGRAPQPRQNAGITPPSVPGKATIQLREARFKHNYMIFIGFIANTPLCMHATGARATWDPVVPIFSQILSNHAFSCGCQSVASGILRGDRRRPCFVPDAPRVLIPKMSKRHAYSSSGRAACDQVTGSKVRWARETYSP